MTDQTTELLTATLLAAGSGVTMGLSNLLPEGAVVEFLIGFAGTLAGGAVTLIVLKERVRILTESDRDLWNEIGRLRQADTDHVNTWHRKP